MTSSLVDIDLLLFLYRFVAFSYCVFVTLLLQQYFNNLQVLMCGQNPPHQKAIFWQTKELSALFSVFNKKRVDLTDNINIAVQFLTNNKNNAKNASFRGQKEKKIAVTINKEKKISKFSGVNFLLLVATAFR